MFTGERVGVIITSVVKVWEAVRVACKVFINFKSNKLRLAEACNFDLNLTLEEYWCQGVLESKNDFESAT